MNTRGDDHTGANQPLGHHWEEVLRALDSLLFVLKANHMPHFLMQMLFKQIFAFVNVQLFNQLLLRRECCSFSNGEYVKSGLSEVERWIDNAGRKFVGDSWEDLKFIRQVPFASLRWCMVVSISVCVGRYLFGHSSEAKQIVGRDHHRSVPSAECSTTVSYQYDVLGRQVQYGDRVAGGAASDETADGGQLFCRKPFLPVG